MSKEARSQELRAQAQAKLGADIGKYEHHLEYELGQAVELEIMGYTLRSELMLNEAIATEELIGLLRRRQERGGL